jgi:hypothetical protein
MPHTAWDQATRRGCNLRRSQDLAAKGLISPQETIQQCGYSVITWRIGRTVSLGHAYVLR